MNHAAERGDRESLLHCQHDFVNQFACMRADDVRAHDLVLSYGANDLCKAFGLLFGLGSVIVRKGSSVNMNIRRPELRLCFVFRQADSSDFGISECGPGNDTKISLLQQRPKEQSVANYDRCFISGHVREGKMARHIASSENLTC